MFFSSIITLTTVLGLVYLVASRLREWHRLRHIPGPFWARFTHLWIIRHVLKGQYIDQTIELHARYGPVIVIAPDFVSLSDPEEIKQLGKVRSSWGRGRSYIGFRLCPGTAGDFVVSMRDEKAHARMRAKLMPGYAGKTIEGVEKMIDKHVSQLVSIIESRYISEPGTSYRPVDFSRLAQYLAIDIITSFAFQESFSCLERDDDFHGYITSVSKAFAPLISLSFLPLYQTLMDTPAFNMLFPDGGFFPRVLEVARRQVGKRYGKQAHELKDQNDVLSTWVASGMSEEELVNETVAQLGAGGETTGTGVRAVMLYMMTSPRSYQALQREIDDALQTGTVTSCPPSEDEAAKLPYLQAVLKESLRLLVPAGFVPRCSPNDETLCGYKIPAGVSVDLAYKPALRTKEIFGEDADFFRPERWLEAGETERTQMDETYRFVFGGPSRWECLGKGVALMQMHKVVFELFRLFNFTLVNPATPWKAANTRVWTVNDFFVQITKRDLAEST
ncbi:uncharacterized protein JN550_012575 [Neoarthrinium moseri]|uniref:uncharacterized protein n=1 Tax=Neoarthrinium moseri TaxID=1658444 RepID=UPI001FDD8B12|nr:uncharacterized protein JN550_012575 [Neoarthrinium moseri]KAI1858528.1 hypothetical protein JN550_012575 [Neoarthrinium moseri]